VAALDQRLAERDRGERVPRIAERRDQEAPRRRPALRRVRFRAR
jgi:hypothetical protein